MSLSFVSKSIQTQGEDGEYEEQAIEGSENDASSKEIHCPLFDQLRANKEKEDEEKEEFQRSLMRGTLALDEDDAAYLGELQRQREKAEAAKRHETELELAAFHAAKMEQSEKEKNSALEESNNTRPVVNHYAPSNLASVKAQAITRIIPKITTRKRKIETNLDQNVNKEPSASIDTQEKPKQSPSGLGGLLSGYGSDSSDGE